MHVSTHLNIDMIALDQSDQVTVLIELTAPENPASAQRLGRTLMLLLDRSGSMSGDPLEGAKDAISRLIRRLAPQDCLGLVIFDDQAELVIPPMLMADHNVEALQRAVSNISSRGGTDLSAGYLLALRETKRSLAETGHTGATVLLVSDGHANGGITDPTRLRKLAAKALTGGITTSTLGLGLGYDEYLLQELTTGGNGNHSFAPDVDTAVQAITQTVTDLLDVSVLAATLRITPKDQHVDGIRIRQDIPLWREPGALVVNLGDMYAGEERKLLITLDVPAVANLGTTTIADLDLNFTSVPDLADHHVSFPVTVNVVPGDEARSRVPNPLVEVEELIADADDAKKSMITSLRDNDMRSARSTLASTMKNVNDKRKSIKDAGDSNLSARLDIAAMELLNLNESLQHQSMEFSSKLMTQSFATSSRGRKKKNVIPSSNNPDGDEESGEEI
jgi:Ca-activated chloride channel family protein